MKFLVLNNQIGISNISVGTPQAEEDLNYFTETNLFVSKFKVAA